MSKICIFDLDGTLTDPALGITKSYQKALAAFGIDEELPNLTRFIGPPLRGVFADVYGFSAEETERAVTVFREYFATTGLYENEVYPGVMEMLQRLREVDITMAVATSKVKDYSQRILEHFQLAQYFAFVSGDAMDGSLTKNGKQEIIRLALSALDPERKMTTVMIGDREHDILGAKQNGLASIGATWGYGSRAELAAAGADYLVDTPAELVELVLTPSPPQPH
ncbi:MAG: HAD hydrolase-like protein [Lachnospiraceae bacterium]|jgi:phosphoglycolate phosphatase|nr:HAD hydrolase-like protein [Lachnospiraceae bacterium]